jgi:hypothetical protein
MVHGLSRQNTQKAPKNALNVNFVKFGDFFFIFWNIFVLFGAIFVSFGEIFLFLRLKKSGEKF